MFPGAPLCGAAPVRGGTRTAHWASRSTRARGALDNEAGLTSLGDRSHQHFLAPPACMPPLPPATDSSLARLAAAMNSPSYGRPAAANASVRSARCRPLKAEMRWKQSLAGKEIRGQAGKRAGNVAGGVTEGEKVTNEGTVHNGVEPSSHTCMDLQVPVDSSQTVAAPGP